MANAEGVHTITAVNSRKGWGRGGIIRPSTLGIKAFDGTKNCDSLGQRRMGVHKSTEGALNALTPAALKG
jgi:hypothetical protein